MKKFLIAILALSISIATIAQGDFKEGVLSIEQTVTSTADDIQTKMMIAQMGKLNTKAFVKGSKTRSEVQSEATGDMVMIIDAETLNSLVLMDNPSMGKIYMNQSLAPSEDALNNILVEKKEDTKTILGYECEHYIITIKDKDQENKIELYATDKIKGVVTQQTAIFGDKFTAFPLWTKMRMNQMGMDLTVVSEVKSITEQELSEDLFSMIPPEGYKNIGQ